MKTSCKVGLVRLAAVLALLASQQASPRRAAADVSHVMHSRYDERGSAVHAVPLWNDQVRMLAERVVLVPWYDAKTHQPRLLCHVWYDLVNEGRPARLEVGFPELKSRYQEHVKRSMGTIHTFSRLDRRWTLPTITAFAARVGRRYLPSGAFAGVGRYRQWYTFGLDLPAGERVRLHTTYLATLGSSMFKMDRDEDDPRGTTSYHLHYILHTGARWRGPIGKGEILLYSRGRLRTLRRFADLEPTPKDDLHVPLDLTVDRAQEDAAEELAPGEHGHRNHPGTRLCRSRLLSASTTLESGQLDTHVGLVVDGDAETQWVSAKGKGIGAIVQLPSNPDKDLTELRVTSGAPAGGAARPSGLKISCQKGWRKTLVASPELPDRAGPHVVSMTKPQRCDALHLEVTALHGNKSAAVAIAELEQRFAEDDPEKDPPFQGGSIGAAPDPLTPSDSGPGSKKYPAPPPADPRSFQIAGIEGVSFSGDQTLLHYQLHLEDQRGSLRSVRLGYFVDVGTGKKVRAYRMDRDGDLPEPYRTDWEQAMSYEEGTALLGRHGFVGALTSRAAPRKSVISGQRLRLDGGAKGEAGALRVTPGRSGFTWRYASRPSLAEGRAEALLQLHHEAKGRTPTLLASRALVIDRAFAVRHQATWQAHKKVFEEGMKAYLAELERHGLETSSKPEDSLKWHALTYRLVHAHGGEARVFWHPQGETLAVFWSDHRDHMALSRSPDAMDVIPECAELEGIRVCPWERRDDPRHLVEVTVHALSPRDPTKLLEPYRPPTGDRQAGPQVPGGAGAGAPAAGKRSDDGVAKGAETRPDEGRGARTPKKRGGCGCRSGGPDGLLPVALAWLLAGFVRRRREEER
ncbi:MAG: hypothetical protein RBU30_06545 [Polyangia bacterium]|jgi:MYXO-CTERM domain-containing protein|nr:hypothetical protein [Polyangia bacterium]